MKYIKLFFITLFSFSFLYAEPKPWQLGFQTPASPVMEYIFDFHNFILIIMLVVVVFVTVLLCYVLIKFSKKNNPQPKKIRESLLLEVIWTIIPTIIVLIIAVPSLKVLKYEEQIPESEFTLKVIGHQWYWSYNYPDHNEINFDSNIQYDKEPRLLAVDNEVVLPVNTNIRVQITASDVIHSWAIPALGIKRDAIPGRLNETWVNIQKEGMYYGQCSELCGILHGFMPIAIRAVSMEEFNNWIEEKKKNI